MRSITIESPVRNEASEARDARSVQGTCRLVAWLPFAATPILAILAWSASIAGPIPMGYPAHNVSPFNDMALMYGLMATFHASPWLHLLLRKASGLRSRPPACRMHGRRRFDNSAHKEAVDGVGYSPAHRHFRTR